MNKPISITVGGGGSFDPTPGTSVLNIPLLKGKEFYLEKIGVGTFPYADYQALTSGGLQLLNSLVFVADDKYFIHETGVGYQSASGNYTNGFDLARTMNALFGRVGWKNNLSGLPTLATPNNISRGGRYFQDFHSLVTLAHVKAVMAETVTVDADFNAFLEAKQRAVILRALNAVYREIEYLEQTELFTRYADNNDRLIANTGKFVGVRITPCKAVDISMQIDSVSLYFNDDVTFNLYLFQDNKQLPIMVQEVSAVANDLTVVDLSDVVLNRSFKGVYYLGYFQDDLGSVQAIDENHNHKACTKCFRADFIESIKDLAGYDFLRSAIPYGNYTYGLNLSMSSFRDHTSQIVKKSALFDELIGLMMAYTVLEDVIYTTRSNASERILKDQLASAGLQLDVNGVAPISDSPKITGLKGRIEKEAERLRKSFFPKPKGQTVNLAECWL